MISKNIKKCLMAGLMTFVMVVSSVVPAMAATEVTSTSGTAQSEITKTVESEFSVLVPKTVTMTSNTQEYEIRARGNIAPTEFLDVSVDKEVDMKRTGDDAYDDMNAEMTLKDCTWDYETLIAEYTSKSGIVSFAETKAGEYKGTATFYVNLKTNIIGVTAKDENGNDLNASANVIVGDKKQTLLESLASSSLVDAEKVDALVEIKSDDFDGLADTTFDVSNIAKEGDQVVILHYNETTKEWEYITTETVDANGTVGGNFESFSPVVFIVLPKNSVFLGSAVIDFALPINVKVGKIGEGVIQPDKCTSYYGNIEVSGDNTVGEWEFTYTLTQTINGVDLVQFVTDKDEIFVYKIYPASSVFYDNNFVGIEYTGTWVELTSESHGDGKQDIDLNNTPYEYDTEYSNDSYYIGGTSMATGLNQDKGSKFVFYFTGTGIDVYFKLNKEMGLMLGMLSKVEEVVDENGNVTIKETAAGNYIVDGLTYSGDFYGSPVMSFRDYEYGNYKLQMAFTGASESATGSKRYQQVFDGIRVFGAAKTGVEIDAVYEKNNESNCSYSVIRDILLSQNALSSTDSFAGSVFIDYYEGEIGLKTDSFDIYKQKGPKKEVYLSQGQGIAFDINKAELNNPDSIQIGVKTSNAVGGTIKVSTLSGKSKIIDVNHSLDMYYEISELLSSETETIIVQNISDDNSLIVLTSMKYGF